MESLVQDQVKCKASEREDAIVVTVHECSVLLNRGETMRTVMAMIGAADKQWGNDFTGNLAIYLEGMQG